MSIFATEQMANYEQYHDFLDGVSHTFHLCQNDNLFTTATTNLYDIYLNSFAPEHRQHYTCHCCRQFINTFGSLVVVNNSTKESAIWQPDMVPDCYKATVKELAAAAVFADIEGVFISDKAMLGTPQTGIWRHFAVALPKNRLHKDRLKTPHQYIAAKKENFLTVLRALNEFELDQLTMAKTILEAEALSRNERYLAPINWLIELRKYKNKNNFHNRLWAAIATAPEGFCHPRASVLGQLLQFISEGLSFEQIKSKWEYMLHPLQYQRPQAAPAYNNIKQAEEIVKKLGIETALQRRVARLQEIPKLWQTKVVKTDGVFAHLTAKSNSKPALNLPAKLITWEKFSNTVLNEAEKIEIKLQGYQLPLCAYVTAVDLTAPPIIKWDQEEERNPVTLYFYHGGSDPAHWGLSANKWLQVTAICLRPNMWGSKPKPELGESVTFMLEGMRESQSPGLALFPETLKQELYPMRATIEQFSQRGVLQGLAEGDACGISLSKERQMSINLRVTSKNKLAEYTLDRWD